MANGPREWSLATAAEVLNIAVVECRQLTATLATQPVLETQGESSNIQNWITLTLSDLISKYREESVLVNEITSGTMEGIIIHL